MRTTLVSRRAFTLGVSAVPVGLSVAARALGETGSSVHGARAQGEGLTHSAQAIHQEVTFEASCQRVYAALTSTQQFDAATRLSDAVSLLTAPNAQATSISPAVGGPFTLFGGYITGRHLELVPAERLVQAWRAGSWGPGDYSIVKFVLVTQGAGCHLLFDHRGFPEGQGSSLAYGWRVHYWEPLAKLLAQG
jgi:activator of HSP90 ATPase